MCFASQWFQASIKVGKPLCQLHTFIDDPLKQYNVLQTSK